MSTHRTLFMPDHEIFDDMLNQFFDGVFETKNNGNKYPLTNIYEEDSKVYMEIAVAGFSKDEITIAMQNDNLVIKGVSLKEDTSTRNYLKKDIAMRNFEKSFNLLTPVESINATYVDGILHIELIPKQMHDNIGKIEIK